MYEKAEISGYKAMDDYLNGGINNNSNILCAALLDTLNGYCNLIILS